MSKVFKYPCLPGRFTVGLPKDAKPLCAALQNGEPQMWALVDETAPLVKREFVCAGTGHDLPQFCNLDYIGTIHGVDGWMVFHLFEVRP